MPGERFIEIAKDPAKLCLRHGCLVVQREGLPDASVATFEISAVVLAHPRCVITQPAMNALMEAGVPLLVCDGSMLPSGMMLPMRANTLQTQRMLAQAAAPLPLKKRMWQQVIRAKIRAQAAALEGLHGEDGGLRSMAERVASGDPKNVEATAAQRYWPLLFRDPAFRRRFDAPDQNALLNYGYAVARAAVGRAIAAVGLHPSLGIRHKGRGNAYCLADDLVEPYRPLVDAEVAKIVGEQGAEAPLGDAAKRRLVELLEVRIQARTGVPDVRTVSECIGMTAFSLAEAFGGVRQPDETPADVPRQSRSGKRVGGTLFFPVGLTQW